MDFYESNNGGLIRFDKLNVIFKQIKTIELHSNNSHLNLTSQFKAIPSILNNINKLSYSKLETITLWCSFKKTEDMRIQAQLFKMQCKQNNWDVQFIGSLFILYTTIRKHLKHKHIADVIIQGYNDYLT
eukprot:393208_1